MFDTIGECLEPRQPPACGAKHDRRPIVAKGAANRTPKINCQQHVHKIKNPEGKKEGQGRIPATLLQDDIARSN